MSEVKKFSICLLIILQGFSLFRCNSICSEGTFACADSEKCLPHQFFCNGRTDCSDGSDEIDCGDFTRVKATENFVNEKRMKGLPILLIEHALHSLGATILSCGKCACRAWFASCYGRGLQSVPALGNKFERLTFLLDLRGNTFNCLKKHEFQNFSALNDLFLTSVELQEMENGIFSNNNELTHLMLDHNQLRYLPEDWFCSTSSLTVLKLYKNLIEELNEGNFRNFRQLIELDLGNNRIKKLHKSYFQNLVALKYLFLDENALEVIEFESFPRLENLIMLFLNKNKIATIDPRSFSGLPDLRVIVLSENRLKKLSSGIFENLNRLNFLDLRRNSIARIAEDVFQPTKQLKSLDLKGNQVKMRKVSKKIFQHATSLSFINFDDFFLCSAAIKVPVCEAKGHGAMIVEYLLGNIFLRTGVWIMGILACGGNIVAFLARLLMSNSTYSIYILNLALSDSLMGVYLIIIALADLEYRDSYGQHQGDWLMHPFCLFGGVLNALNSVLSVFILSLITWDSHGSMTEPLIGRQKNTRKVLCITTVIWMASLCLSLAPMVFQRIYFGDEFYTSNSVCLGLYIQDPYAEGWEYSTALFIFLNAVGLIYNALAHTKMLSVIKSSAVGFRSAQKSQDPVPAIRVAIIVGTKCLCWILVIVIKLMALFGVHIPETVNPWLAIWVLPMSSVVNPLVHTLTTTTFKEQIFRLFGKRSNRFPIESITFLLNSPGPICVQGRSLRLGLLENDEVASTKTLFQEPVMHNQAVKNKI